MQFKEIEDMYLFGDKLGVFRNSTFLPVSGAVTDQTVQHILWSVWKSDDW